MLGVVLFVSVLLSFGAVNALIPIMIIIILIAAAAGLMRGYDLFAIFGISTLVGAGSMTKKGSVLGRSPYMAFSKNLNLGGRVPGVGAKFAKAAKARRIDNVNKQQLRQNLNNPVNVKRLEQQHKQEFAANTEKINSIKNMKTAAKSQILNPGQILKGVIIGNAAGANTGRVRLIRDQVKYRVMTSKASITGNSPLAVWQKNLRGVKPEEKAKEGKNSNLDMLAALTATGYAATKPEDILKNASAKKTETENKLKKYTDAVDNYNKVLRRFTERLRHPKEVRQNLNYLKEVVGSAKEIRKKAEEVIGKTESRTNVGTELNELRINAETELKKAESLRSIQQDFAAGKLTSDQLYDRIRGYSSQTRMAKYAALGVAAGLAGLVTGDFGKAKAQFANLNEEWNYSPRFTNVVSALVHKGPAGAYEQIKTEMAKRAELTFDTQNQEALVIKKPEEKEPKVPNQEELWANYFANIQNPATFKSKKK
ncbi:MAG: hypothetical protein ACP5T3_02955 [Candidatus Micrarchaeia archaeon]